MRDDDELCLCFHVTKRKVVNYIRVNRPRVASQLSECFGAGTGCGWCRPFLRRLMEQQEAGEQALPEPELPEPEEYAAARREYRQRKGIGE